MTDFKVQPAAHGEGILDESVHEATLDAINDWLATLSTEAIASAATAVRNAVAEEKRQAEEEAARAAIESDDDGRHEQAPWRG